MLNVWSAFFTYRKTNLDSSGLHQAEASRQANRQQRVSKIRGLEDSEEATPHRLTTE